jgi:hypothetical protein
MPSRVLLLHMPGILSDLVRGIVSDHEDIEVVASLSDPALLESVAGANDIGVVITVCNSEERHLAPLDEFLAGRPHRRVLAIEDDARTAYLYELRPRRTSIGPLSPEALIDFVRGSPGSLHPPPGGIPREDEHGPGPPAPAVNSNLAPLRQPEPG